VNGDRALGLAGHTSRPEADNADENNSLSSRNCGIPGL
jgi:hypothetical protein